MPRVLARSLIRGVVVAICLVLFVVTVWGILPSRTPDIAVAFSHFETFKGIDCAVVQISNLGSRPATCSGYAWGSPFYLIATDAGTNWVWDSPGVDRLPPQSKMSVRTLIPIPERWVVGVEYRAQSIEDRLPRRVWLLLSRFKSFLPGNRSKIAWSEPITRSSKPRQILPGVVTSGDHEK